MAVTESIRRPDSLEHQQILDEFEMEYDSDKNHIKSQAFIRAMRAATTSAPTALCPMCAARRFPVRPRWFWSRPESWLIPAFSKSLCWARASTAYRWQQGDKTWTLADLLEKVSDIAGVHWVRFITSHPGYFDDSILQVMADLPKVCPYLHIPAQSGSDRILKAMNRGYTSTHYMALMDKARATVPDIAIAGDFIVGFPGEPDQDYQATAKLIRRVRYKNCFIFKYSPRPGTRAEQKLTDDIPDEIKQQRNMELLEIVNQIAEEDNKRFVGKTLEVLVEGPSKKAHLNAADSNDNPQLIGRTAHDYIVVFNGPASLAGQFIKVSISKTSPLTLFGNLA